MSILETEFSREERTVFLFYCWSAESIHEKKPLKNAQEPEILPSSGRNDFGENGIHRFDCRAPVYILFRDLEELQQEDLLIKHLCWTSWRHPNTCFVEGASDRKFP